MSSDTTPSLSPADAAAASFAYQSLGSLRDLALVSLAVVFGPLLIYGLWTFLSNWGWWRVARNNGGDIESGRLSNRRRQYIRTWHGWVETKSTNHSPVEVTKGRSGHFHKSSRSADTRPAVSMGERIKDFLRPKTITTDFNRIFWDPGTQAEGGSSGSRFWWQKWLNGNAQQTNDRFDEEKGISTVGKWKHSASNHPLTFTASSRVVGCGSLSTGCETEDNDTVRRRIGAEYSNGLWCSGSEETQRATWLQLFYPRQRLAHTTEQDTPDEARNDLELGLNRVIPSRQLSLSQRTISGLRLPTPPLTRHLSAMLLRRTSLLSNADSRNPRLSSEPTLPFHQTISRHKTVGSPGAPRNSLQEATPQIITPQADNRNQLIEKGTAEMCVDRAASSSFEADFADNLTRSLDVWASPMIVDLHSSSSRGTSGISGRRGSPAMGWRAIDDQPETLYEDLNNYDVEGSTNQSNRGSPSSSMLILPAGSPKIRAVSAGDGVLLTAGTSPRISSQSPFGKHSHKVDDADTLGYILPRQPALRASSLPQTRHVRSTSRPDRTLHASVSRSRSVGALTQLRSVGGIHQDVVNETIHKNVLSTSEKTFLNDLDRKLNWLHHELSPGFRSPEDNPAESFWIATGTASKVRPSGERQAHGDEIPISGRRLILPNGSRARRPSVRRTLPTPKIDSWRSAVNRFRTGTWHSTDPELLNAITQFEGSTDKDRKEGTIDTAAWILRRPPQGWPTISKRHLSLEGPITGHQDWEKIRRPIKVTKRQTSGKTITPLVRRFSADISKILHIRDNGNSIGGSSVDSIRKRHRTTGPSGSNDENSRSSFVQTPRLGIHPNDPLKHEIPSSTLANNGFPTMSGALSPVRKNLDGEQEVTKSRSPFKRIGNIHKPQLQKFVIARVPDVSCGGTANLGEADRNAADFVWREEAKMVIFEDVMECGLGV